MKDSTEALLVRAEALLARFDDTPGATVRDLVYELGVHTLELAAANLESSDRVRAVAAERDELLELFDAAPAAYVVLDGRGKVERFNRRAAELLGVEDMRGPFVSLIPSAEVLSFHLHLRRVMDFGADRCELEFCHPEGRTLALQLDSNRQTAKLHAESRCRMILTDSSERKVAERRRHAAELLLEQMGQAIDDVFYVRDGRTGKLLYVNSAYANVWGEPPRLGDTLREWPPHVHAKDRARAIRCHRLLLEGLRLDEVYEIVRPDGEQRWIHDRGVLVHDAGSRYVTGVARDVTREHLLRTELQQAQKLEAVGRLASGVAHEYNNLLMGIQGRAAAGLATIGSCSAHTHGAGRCPVFDHLFDIEQAVARGRGLAKELLNLHHSGTSEGVALVDAVLAKLDGILSRLLGDSVQCQLDAGAPGCAVPLSEGQIELLLLNLALNARDAMPEGGRLWVQTREVELDATSAERAGCRPGRQVEVRVRDEGRGMDPATLERAFEPFFTTKGRGKGTGLGLSTVRAMVVGCGGGMRLDSSPGKGTSITLYLPRRDEPVHERAAAPRVDRVTVLAVDDEALVLMSVEFYLASLGHAVLAAGRPSAALRVCDEHAGPIDLLLVDISMPEMSGTRLAHEIRMRRPGIRVLFMSAHSRRVLLAEGRIEPTMATLEKPFGPRELGDAIGRVMAP